MLQGLGRMDFQYITLAMHTLIGISGGYSNRMRTLPCSDAYTRGGSLKLNT